MISEEDYTNLWRVPMSIDAPRESKDKSGGACLSADVALNADWFKVGACLSADVALNADWLKVGACMSADVALNSDWFKVGACFQLTWLSILIGPR